MLNDCSTNFSKLACDSICYYWYLNLMKFLIVYFVLKKISWCFVTYFDRRNSLNSKYCCNFSRELKLCTNWIHSEFLYIQEVKNSRTRTFHLNDIFYFNMSHKLVNNYFSPVKHNKVSPIPKYRKLNIFKIFFLMLNL